LNSDGAAELQIICLSHWYLRGMKNFCGLR